MDTKAWGVAKQSFAIQAEALTAAAEQVDRGAFEKAVDALRTAPRIAASGCGHSGIACMHFAHLMCCIHRPARFIYPSEGVHGGLGYLQKGDVLVMASRGGKTGELLPMLQYARRQGVFLIGITENMESPLAEQSDVALKMQVLRETDRHNLQGTTSFVVLSAIFDALQAALIEETGFTREQFAAVHPGGAVGERLNGCK